MQKQISGSRFTPTPHTLYLTLQLYAHNKYYYRYSILSVGPRVTNTHNYYNTHGVENPFLIAAKYRNKTKRVQYGTLQFSSIYIAATTTATTPGGSGYSHCTLSLCLCTTRGCIVIMRAGTAGRSVY